MKIDVKKVPFNEELLYRYLLNTELFPIGHKGSPKQYFARIERELARIERELARLGGESCTAKNPLQLVKSCLKTLKDKGFYKLRFRNLWERVEFNIPMNNKLSDWDPNALMNLGVVS